MRPFVRQFAANPLCFLIATAFLNVAPAVRADDLAAKPAPVTGKWNSTFGPLSLTQSADRVSGTYDVEGVSGRIDGKLSGRTLEFRYFEGETQGEGRFEFTADTQSFRGQWRVLGGDWNDWTGTRIADAQRSTDAPARSPGRFDGLWSTTYGPMRLACSGDEVRGTYAWNGISTVLGKCTTAGELTFTYTEPGGQQGEGRFTLDAGGESFAGSWRTKETPGGSWSGARVKADPKRVWLIVLESNWEETLATPEFSYGQMLKSFFTRLPHVEVRHRFIHNAADFRRWAAEAAYFAEPVVLYISTHGTEAGAIVGPDIVGAEELIGALKHIDSLRLLHFGSCQVMAGEIPKKIAAGRSPQTRFPISGFAKPADWAGSAIVDFTYLELVLGRGMDPREAAAQTKRLIKFADEIEETPIAGSGFTIYAP